MNYKIEELETQLIENLRASSDLSGVNIATHAGGITGAFFQDPQLLEGIITQLPFIFVQYQGKQRVLSSSARQLDIHLLQWRFFVAAQSLRTTRESQVSAYSLLRALYDTTHGKYFDYSRGVLTPTLTGTEIATTEMNQQQPLFESGGQNEGLIVNLPRIVVYQTDYTCQFIA